MLKFPHGISNAGRIVALALKGVFGKLTLTPSDFEPETSTVLARELFLLETRPASVISTANVVERKIDKHGNYTSDIGDMYRVERLQPIPFKVSINVDV